MVLFEKQFALAGSCVFVPLDTSTERGSVGSGVTSATSGGYGVDTNSFSSHGNMLIGFAWPARVTFAGTSYIGAKASVFCHWVLMMGNAPLAWLIFWMMSYCTVLLSAGPVVGM